jgi:catechol 2,3-dioxygenase-like lactoylglutathione lyase family enzyme
LSLGGAPLLRVELPCRDIGRQRDFFLRILGLAPQEGVYAAFRCGAVQVTLRPRGDALFPHAGAAGAGGVLLAFPVPDDELERWHRRMMMARVAVLDAPGANGAAPRALRIADPEGNVIELFSGPS